MDNSALIECFQDTLHLCGSSKLKNLTKRAKKGTVVYNENIFAGRCTEVLGDECTGVLKDESQVIDVIEGTSFAIAKKYIHYGKVGVLNFANPHYPGGGVKNGAIAQEECLCRSSNLYPCLCTDIARTEYYNYHKSKTNYFFSDRIIYSEGITVFKNDDLLPLIMPENEWFNVSVITCSAPYIAKRKYTNKTALKELFKKRIKNIFEVALENRIDVLILGAFGCGAFKNPPEIVASAFHEVIRREGYITAFEKIIFAIKSTRGNNSFDVCPNIAAFKQEFNEAAQNCDSAGNDFKEKNKYKNKQFSILGDSISTLEGYNPRGYNVFYTGENCIRSNVREMNDTWWGKVIKFFEGELLVNNSWSGSRVTKLPNRSELFPSGCSDERTSSLHINTIMPDVIIVNLGSNDWAFGARIIDETHVLESDNEFNSFEIAYDCMLKKLRKNYPNSEIWCCTLTETYMSSHADFKFPYKYAGIHIDEYNNIIRKACWENECKLIDLYCSKIAYDSIDGSHPTKAGMDTIATGIIQEIIGVDVNKFMDYKEKQTFSDEMMSNKSQYNQNTVHSEYVMLPSNITSKLYLDILRLTIRRIKQQVVFCQQQEVYVDKTPSGDFIFESDYKMITHCQATFFYEQGMWFLRDNYSEEGIWLNGIRMQSGKKYQLTTNDVIDFAHFEEVIFDNDNDLMSLTDENAASIASSKTNTIKFTKYSQQDKKSFESGAVMKKQDELIGAVIENKYSVLQLLNYNSFLKVYLVKNIHNNTLWAMKSCNKTNKNYTSVVREEVIWETHIIRKLQHSAVPHILDIIEDDRYIFIVREYIEGIDLECFIRNAGAQSVERVIYYGKQLCDFLGYMHHFAPPFIYRDMKPANVILMPNGQLKVIDFGTVLEYDRIKGDSHFLGTKGYAPPEQYEGYSDIRTDIYALGMTMHQLVTGVDPTQPPYETQPICLINPNLPKGLEYIILKCIQINPRYRYQSCYELMYDLNNYMSLLKSKKL